MVKGPPLKLQFLLTNMLSYMLPVEDKPPSANVQLELELQRSLRHPTTPPPAPPQSTANISTESSVSSLSSKASDAAAVSAEKPARSKALQNGECRKSTALKRVSFGSSKGSMVETLIYESPLQEEPEVSTPTPELARFIETDKEYSVDSRNPSTRVRVSFFECGRPQVVHSPEPADTLADLSLLDAPNIDSIMTSASPLAQNQYQRQASTDSGWENPFRPDGDLSREADEIVERIREGKPINPVQCSPKNGTIPTAAASVTDSATAPAATINGMKPANANGGAGGAVGTTGAVTVQRGVAAQSASEPEHVVLNKKKKCSCCVIQ